MFQLILWNGQKKKFWKKISIKKFWKKFFCSSPNICQAKSGGEKISLYWWEGEGDPPQKKVAQNDDGATKKKNEHPNFLFSLVMKPLNF